jgi:phosphoenolpyruvate carboxykinase (ATP)
MSTIKWNPNTNDLLSDALQNESVIQTPAGAICVWTGTHTGRSPNAKSLVEDEITSESVDWTHNIKASLEEFTAAKLTVLGYLRSRTQYKQRLFAGHDKNYRLKVVVTTEYAWQSLFAQNMFIKPTEHELMMYEDPDWNLYCAPSASDTPCVMIDFTHQEIIIMGTHYAGEIKKSIFTVLNLLLPQKNILPMHCSVNVSLDRDNPAIFFGLSGTGKTTLSSDKNRLLIGDDEHGWSSSGLFNFEGGCYAKVINLSKESEPQIWNASQNEGAILENVILDSDGVPDFSDGSLTENTRASYDLSKIENTALEGQCGHPKNVVFLTCDAFGVLPPVSKLSSDDASDHFIMGYTAKVAGTEAGISEPVATFSHCFGAPFMPLPAIDYANLLQEKIEKYDVNCWLVNTGWSGGSYGVGSRMPIEVSREIINSIIDGSMAKKKFATHEHTGFEIPEGCTGLLSQYVNPECTWSSIESYKEAADNLMSLFCSKRKELNL